MKNFIIYQICIVISTFIFIGCNSNSKPSIKENSVRKVEVTTNDYSDIAPESLFKHITAHFDLEQYKIGKEKLTTLIENNPELIDSMGLNSLKNKFDSKLAEMQEKEAAIAEAERKKRMPNAVKNMRQFKKGTTTHYVDKSSPEFDTKECFYAYFTKDRAGILELHFKIRYIDTQWLNIENYMITVDQLDHNLSGTIDKTETKGKKKYKHEELDTPVDTAEKLKTIQAIANGNDVVALYVGKTDYKKRTITSEQKTAIRNVLDAYAFMGGTNFKELKSSYTNANDE